MVIQYIRNIQYRIACTHLPFYTVEYNITIEDYHNLFLLVWIYESAKKVK